MRHPRVPVIACALLCLLTPGVRADDREAELRQLFETGMKHFRAQEYPDAAVSFERFLEMKPDPDLVLSLERESGLRAFQQMLMQKGLKEIAMRLMRVAELRREKVSTDPALIASLIAEVDQVRERDDARNFESYLDAKERLVRIGAPAAPGLIARLTDEKHDKVRSRVQITLVEMRGEAVLPLVASLADPRKLMRQNACVVLGQIGDRRAVAALKARLEDPAELAEVKSAAGEALRKITGAEPDTLPSAPVCYQRLAEGYHNADPGIVRQTSAPEQTVWYFDTARKEVAGRGVPGYTYNDHMAEQACYEALRIAPDYAPVLPTLICVTFSQMNEVDALLAIATQRLVAGEAEASEVEALKDRRQALAKGRALALSTGKGPLYAALQRAMDHGEIPVAVSCCEALQALEDGTWLPPTPLTMELTGAWGKAWYFPGAR
jgi:hypothetical protein